MGETMAEDTYGIKKVRVELDVRKSAQENAAACFEQAKKAKERLAGVKAALEDSRKELEKLQRENEMIGAAVVGGRLSSIRIKRKKEWYEQFHFFFTPSGKLVIGGRSAKQNDLIYAKYLEENDLFFHADIQGAPATVLKDGNLDAGDGEGKHSGAGGIDENEKLLVAQFSASYSSAWKIGVGGVDVYCVKKDQLAKHAHGGFIGKGGFAIIGEREWFRKTPLGIKVYLDSEGIPRTAPERMQVKERAVSVFAGGNDEKGHAAKKIAKLLSCDVDEINLLLPSGNCRVVGWKKEE